MNRSESDYTFISTPDELRTLLEKWTCDNVDVVAMDFEEESNLHCYGEHLCIIQLYDRREFYIIDVLAIAPQKEGLSLLKTFLEGPVMKIMFACQSDASLARKVLGIQLENVFDVRIIAMALGFNGNLTALLERSLGIRCESTSEKKKYQTANWMRRPIARGQIEYALSDVKYLFDLKDSLTDEMAEKLSVAEKKQVAYNMRTCALQKNPERPGWEKICNYKLLSREEKIYIKHFFLARDGLAMKADVPAVRILPKQILVAMAKKGTWEGLLRDAALKYSDVFEKARLDALAEING